MPFVVDEELDGEGWPDLVLRVGRDHVWTSVRSLGADLIVKYESREILQLPSARGRRTNIAARTPRRESTSSGSETLPPTEPSIQTAEEALRSFVAEHRASRTELPGELERFERRVMALGTAVVRANLAEETSASEVTAEAIVMEGKTLLRMLLSK